MTKAKIALAAATLAALMTGQVRADDQKQQKKQQEQDAKLCQDLSGVDSALGNLENLSGNSTVDETKAAAKRLSNAADDLSKSAKKARPEEGKQFDKARQDFRDSINNIPNDATIGQVQSKIQGSRTRLKAAYQNLESSVTCPQQQGNAPSMNQPTSAPPSTDMQR